MMRTKELTATYTRTYNIGNYESIKIGFSQTVEVPKGADVTQNARDLFDVVINQVHARAAGIKETETVQKTGSATTVSQPASPPAKPTDAEGKWFDGEFAATDLIAEVREGKTYWKLTDVPGTKFPVNIWPEVLEEAGFAPDAMSPMEVYSLKGYTARYQKNEKGFPNKIVELFETQGNVQVTKSTPPRQEA